MVETEPEGTKNPYPALNTDVLLARQVFRLMHLKGARLTRDSLCEDDNILISGLYISEKWYIPRTVLRHASRHLHRQLADGSTKKWVSEMSLGPAFELFLQWLYTGQYKELAGYAPKLSSKGQRYCLDQQAGSTHDNMAWPVKAAYLACNLASFLEAPRFHNYAMQKLFHAYSAVEAAAKITPNMLQRLGLQSAQKNRLLEDLVIRNWGDTAFVDHQDDAWSAILQERQLFQSKFVKAMGSPLEERRQKPLELKDYLVEEE
jgi:hypothetical protein